ncbi:hypothetical protein GCM10010329_19560 [Streptomyces spiroverticillatus]|nr:hypothetical protein GCM10010329_19560 [Streptomyces spiroverticillatus]
MSAKAAPSAFAPPSFRTVTVYVTVSPGFGALGVDSRVYVIFGPPSTPSHSAVVTAPGRRASAEATVPDSMPKLIPLTSSRTSGMRALRALVAARRNRVKRPGGDAGGIDSTVGT